MDLEEKKAILVACDFSEWRGWERARRQGTSLSEVHGFGEILFGIGGAVSYLADGYESERSVESLTLGYKSLSNYYATIPFDQLDPSDEDFRFLFDYKKRLDEFGRTVDTFVERVRVNGVKASRDWS